jgi:hypothetical protein
LRPHDLEQLVLALDTITNEHNTQIHFLLYSGIGATQKKNEKKFTRTKNRTQFTVQLNSKRFTIQRDVRRQQIKNKLSQWLKTSSAHNAEKNDKRAKDAVDKGTA